MPWSWVGSLQRQPQRWLKPLLAGEIRSVFFMTEPDVASSDATNMAATAVIDGDHIVLNGKKWWSSGVGDPRCKIGIFMALTPDESKDRHHQHSMVLVPMDTPGVEIQRMLPVFGEYDEPHGHGEVHFHNVRVPIGNFISGPGRGFEIAQGRLGPGRIHHCMRCIGAAEKSLELAIQRGLARTAFRKPLIDLGGNRERIAECRLAIDQARLLVQLASPERTDAALGTGPAFDTGLSALVDDQGPADVLLHVPVDRPLMAANPRVSIFAPYYRERVMIAPGMRG